MTVSNTDLQRVVQTVWSTQLHLELDPADPNDMIDALDREGTVVVTLVLTGGFNGRLEQRCSAHVSMCAAAAAFAATGRDIDTSDIRDAVTEIAHVTAGNLKSLLHGIRRVAAAAPGQAPRPGRTVAEAGFTLEGGPLVVRLIRED